MVDTTHSDLAARERANRTGFSPKILAHAIRSAEPDRYDFESSVGLDTFERVALIILQAVSVIGLVSFLGYLAYLFGPGM